jgi:hypothetical protein
MIGEPGRERTLSISSMVLTLNSGMLIAPDDAQMKQNCVSASECVWVCGLYKDADRRELPVCLVSTGINEPSECEVIIDAHRSTHARGHELRWPWPVTTSIKERRVR